MGKAIRERLTAAISAGLFLFPFSIYLATLAPSLTWQHDGADGGDLIAAACTLGIPHPAGYPLYVLLARLFTFLPWGDIAYRVNLMSAFFAAATIPLVFLASLTLLMGGAEEGSDRIARLAASMTAALAFAFSPVFWSQAIIAEVYTLNAFFVALTIYLLAHHVRTGALPLYPLAFFYGLSLGNHLSMLLLLPAALFLVWRGECGRLLKPKTLAMAFACFLVGLSVYLYLPLRAAQHPPINWGDPHTRSGFAWLVSAQLYRQFVFALPWKYVPGRVSAWLSLLAQQFGWWGLFLALIGLWFWGSRGRTFCGFLAIWGAANSIYAIGYNTADSYIYLIPAFLVMALWLGKGVHCALVALQELLGRMVKTASPRLTFFLSACAFLLLPFLSLAANYKALDLSSDRTASEYGTTVLSALPANAIIIADTDPHTFALWYFHYGEGLRPDVAVLNATLWQYDWYREGVGRLYPRLAVSSLSGELTSLIDGNIGKYPIYLTDPNPQIAARYRLFRRGSAYQVMPDSVDRKGSPGVEPSGGTLRLKPRLHNSIAVY